MNVSAYNWVCPLTLSECFQFIPLKVELHVRVVNCGTENGLDKPLRSAESGKKVVDNS